MVQRRPDPELAAELQELLDRYELGMDLDEEAKRVLLG
jgi:hypothetical protein